MPYQVLLDLKLGRRYIGVQLQGTYFNLDGTLSGLADVTDFSDMGVGNYYAYPILPDDYVGVLKIYEVTAGMTDYPMITSAGISNADATTITVVDQIDALQVTLGKLRSTVDDLAAVVPSITQQVEDTLLNYTNQITQSVEERLDAFSMTLAQQITEQVHNLDIKVVESRTVFGPTPRSTIPIPATVPGKTVISPLAQPLISRRQA